MKFTIPAPPPCRRLFMSHPNGPGTSPEGLDYIRQLRTILAAAGVRRLAGPVSVRLTVHADVSGRRLADIAPAIIGILGADSRPSPLTIPLFAERQVVRVAIRKGHAQPLPNVVVEILPAE